MLSKEPAVLIGIAAAVVAAVSEAIRQATTNGQLNGWTLVVILVPLLAGILTRYNVIPVETVRAVISQARTTSVAVNDLADKVDVATADRPPVS
jgi:ACR3 family arsenite efflux pump ArsB